jgi:predicted ArsR family transcriptional regulator
MKPVDFRNETFAQIQERVSGDRQRVLAAWLEHGPCTTAELAAKSGIPILTLRPRTTDLYQLGFVICVEEETSGGPTGGRAPAGAHYRAATPAEAKDHFHFKHSGQGELGLAS